MNGSLKKIQALLLDLDGTLYLGNQLFPETLLFLDTIERFGLKKLLITNNSSRSTNQYQEKLQHLGIPVMKEEILTSGWATIHYLLHETNFRKVYLLGTKGLCQEFQDEGLEVVNGRDMDGEPESQPDVLVLGFDQEFTYNRLRIASRLLFEDIPYVATHPDTVCPTESWPIPDTGALITYFESITGRKPVIIGKPYPAMIQAALARTQTPAGRTAMVGDRLYTDMQMAVDAHLTAILVLSGETQLADLKQSAMKPDFVFQHVGELADTISECYQPN